MVKKKRNQIFKIIVCCQHLKLSTFRIHKLSGLCHPTLLIFGDYFSTIHPSIKPNELQQFLLSQGGAQHPLTRLP